MKKDVSSIEKMENTLNSKKKKKTSLYLHHLFSKVILYIFSILHRLIELSISFIVIVFMTIPIHLYLIVKKLVLGHSIFKYKSIYGKDAQKVKVADFNLKNSFLSKLSLFYSVISNKLSITGVGLKNYDNKERIVGDSYLFNHKPGIINLWLIRESSKTAYEGKFETEMEYIYKRRPIKDFLLILKFIPALLYRQKSESYSENIDIFGIKLVNLSMKEAVNLINRTIDLNERKKIFFVNPDCLNKIFKDKEYLYILRDKADFIFPDGIGINIATKMINNPLSENVNGTDLLPFLCEMCSKRDYSIFLLGAKPGIPKKMKEKLERKYKDLSIVGFHHGYFDRKTENEKMISLINKKNPDILLVAFGAPNQEKWITENFNMLRCNIAMGVGGLFDFYSGTMKRAPRWMREIGLEWSYRLIQEPGRMWKRYIIGNPLFILRVLKWKLSHK